MRHVGVACVLIGAFSAAQADSGHTSKQPESRLESIVVTDSVAPSPGARDMHSGSVITRAQIHQSPATSVAELLAQESGVTIRRRGASGVQADLGIRGSSFNQTLVVVNGIPIRNPQTGHHNLDVPVPLSQIERIEIIKGPSAIQYGGSATGGVVSITTRDPEQAAAGAELTLGSHDTRQFKAHIGGGLGPTSHLLSASTSRSNSEDADRPTDADIQRGLYTGRANLDQTQLNWGLGVSEKDFGAYGFYSADYPDARERNESRIAWLGGDREVLGWQTRTRAYWQGHDDWFRTRVNGTDSINEHRTDVFGFKSDATAFHYGGDTDIGVNLRRAQIDSNALGDHDRNKVSLFLLRHQQITQALAAQVGMNWVDYSDYGDYFLPSAALSYRFTDQWQAFASAARSAREPTYTERFYDTAANQGDPNLDPEKTHNYELGIKGHINTHWLRATVFKRSSSSLIDFARQPGAITYQADNFDDYDVRGLETSWRWRPDIDWLEEAGLSYDRLHVDLDDQGREIKYARLVPRQTLRAHVRVPVTHTVSVSANARRPDYRDQSTPTLLAALLRWERGLFNASLQARNLLDERVVETGFEPIPGRWYYATVGVNFE